MSITSVDLARMCNVSRTTVDRALKGKPGISEQTRQRILHMAEAYGYRPNALASGLSTGHSAAVGVIVFDLRNQHFSEMVTAIESYFSQKNLLTYICLSDKNPQRERQIIEGLQSRRVDGIVLLPISEGAEFERWLRGLSLPVVTVSNRLGQFPYVGGDGEAAAELGMQNLYDRGYREIHFVCPILRKKGLENVFAQQNRANGYQRFMRQHPDVRGELIDTADYMARVESLMGKSGCKKAFFCSSDSFLLKIRLRMLEQGMDMGACALMGFDGLDYLKQFTQRPASIRYPAETIGLEAAKMLDALIHDEPCETEVLLPCPLLPGNIPD